MPTAGPEKRKPAETRSLVLWSNLFLRRGFVMYENKRRKLCKNNQKKRRAEDRKKGGRIVYSIMRGSLGA